ncbi:hypothetical protein MXB_4516, partial [Myxobolus squamalis]
STGCLAQINQISKDIRLTCKHICGESIADTWEFSSTKTDTVDQIRIQSMDFWLTPNDIYLNICKNAAMLFDSAGFTILTKRPVAEKVSWPRGDQSKVDYIGLESPENS